MQPTVENLCNQLAKHRLLEIDVIKNVRNRWRGESAQADNVPEFRKWLVKNTSLTDFQLEMLDRGFADFLHFGEYNLIERLASGRMAGIYKALHPLGQVVAIKVLPPGKAKHPNLLARFQREARLAVQLDHDNCVRTFQPGQTKEGMHYLVMEFLEGETLEDVLKRRGKLPYQEVVPLLTQTLQGLDHLHELGMIHRDLKPGNLMLVPGEGADLEKSTLQCTVKILDIGLGKALFDEGAMGEDAGELTTEGTLLGTLNYMAPEQARDASSADIRSDLYSVGCVAYAMLAGKPPFVDTNFINQMRRHAEEAPKPLSEHVMGVPAALEAIVMRLLAKDPAMRYSTPGQVLKELKGGLTGPAIPPPPPAPAKPLKSYISWLQEQRQRENQNGVEASAPPKPAPAPAPVPARPAPATMAAPVAAPANPQRTPVAPTPAAATPVAAIPLSPATPAPASVAVAGPTAPVPARVVAANPSSRRGPQNFAHFMATARDWAAFGVGGAFVLLIVLVYALIRLATG